MDNFYTGKFLLYLIEMCNGCKDQFSLSILIYFLMCECFILLYDLVVYESIMGLSTTAVTVSPINLHLHLCFCFSFTRHLILIVSSWSFCFLFQRFMKRFDYLNPYLSCLHVFVCKGYIDTSMNFFMIQLPRELKLLGCTKHSWGLKVSIRVWIFALKDMTGKQ